MGAYLDRLNEQFDEIRDGIDALVTRAAEDSRDVTDAEQAQVDRDRGRLDELQTAIGHYTALEAQGDRVAELRRSVSDRPPTVRTTAPAAPEEYDIAREFPTIADYAIAVHRAQVERDPAARERIERATQHQTTADNPGLIPRPILGPALNFIDATRPFVNSCNRKPLPAGKFDRPKVNQHVDVQKQGAEKDLTASQKMTVALMPVSANTFAGHLNISRQDVKWTSPGILQLVFDDFAYVYAVRTCADAVSQFVASVAGSASVPIVAPADPGKIMKALYAAAAQSLTDGEALPDTLWCAPDVWGSLGGMTGGVAGLPAFPSLSVTSPTGNPMGLNLVVDAHFPAGTAIVGPSQYAEFYEDVDGLMQVQEPDVLGQLVGYAGYTAFLNVNPGTFTKITGAVAEDTGATTSSSSDKSSSSSSSK
jgi:hypothetical protein